MKILLFNPDSANGIGLDIFLKGPPLALMCIAAAAPGHNIEIVDLKIKPIAVSTIRKKIESADIVGITSYTPSIDSALNLARIVKNVNRNIPTIIGGYHATLAPEDTMLHPEIDIVVRGEGEFTFGELVKYFEKNLGKPDWKHGLKAIKGLVYRLNGNLVMTEPRLPVNSLDELPFPNRDLVKKYNYEYFGSPLDAMETARGCPFDCNFCCVRPAYNHCYRVKSPEYVIREIATMRKDARWYAFQDSEFTANMKRVDRIFDLIHQYGYDGTKWYSCQARVDDVCRYPDVVKKMADCGFRFMFLGIESVHQKSLDRIGKRVTLEQVKRAVRMLHDLGIAIFGSIIIGNLDETWDEVMETAQFAAALDLEVVQFTPLTPLPGTRLRKEAEEKGWIVDKDYSKCNLVDPIMCTPHLNTDQIRDAVALSYAQYYLGGRKLQSRNFLLRKLSFLYNPKWWWFWHPKMGLPFMLSGIRGMPKMVQMIKPKKSKAQLMQDALRNAQELSVKQVDAKSQLPAIPEAKPASITIAE